MKFLLTFEFNPFSLFLLIPFVIGVVIWYYHNTIPAVSKRMKIFFLVTRIITLLVLLLIIFHPVLHITMHHTKPAKIAIVLDQSESMKTYDNKMSRAEQALAVLSDPNFKSWNQAYTISFWGISDQLDLITSADDFENMSFEGSLTNLSEVISPRSNTWLDEDMDAVLLLSDGIHNWGRSPLSLESKFTIPVNTIRLGSEKESADLKITQIAGPDFIFTGEEVLFDVSVQGSGYVQKSVDIVFKGDFIESQKKTIVMPPQGQQTSVPFNVTFKQSARQTITASVSAVEGEANFENNTQSQIVQVLKGKYKVLVLGSAPHADLAMLNRTLRQFDMVELIKRTLKTSNTFYEGRWLSSLELADVDVLILFNLPDQKINQSLWFEMTQLIQQKNIPLLFFAGSRINQKKLQWIEDVLPISSFTFESNQLVQPNPGTDRLQSFLLLRTDARYSSDSEFWSNLPPVYSPWKNIQINSESQILMHGLPVLDPHEKKVPLIILRHFKEERSIAILGNGLNRWKLLAAGLGEKESAFDDFLMNSIRWLAIKQEFKPVRMSLQKTVFNAGEWISVIIHVNDAGYQPIRDAEIELFVEDSDQKETLAVEQIDDGLYTAQFQRYQKGHSQLLLNAYVKGAFLGSDSLNFDVSAYRPEMIQTRADHRLLKRLSQRTGGYSSIPDSLAGFLEKLDYPDKTIVEERHIALYASSWVLLVLVLLLSIEWFFRKRKGLL